MPLRPPRTIWLYALASMWKLLLLTAAVLVCVISFAAAVKPLADGKLGPLDTLKYMLYAMPAMLQYALPFAAGFGATLAYHRLAADNEAVAAHAGGISHRALLMPAVLSGVLLGGTVFILSNEVMPRFLKRMADMIALDAAKVLSTSIRRGQPVHFGNMVLYADYCRGPQTDPPQGGYPETQRLWLKGVLLLQLDEDQKIEMEVSAKEARVWMWRDASAAGTIGGDPSRTTRTRVVIQPEDVTGTGEFSGGWTEGTTLGFSVSNYFKDDPKFRGWKDMDRLREHPEELNWIDFRRRELAAGLVQREIIERARASLEAHGEARFSYGPRGMVSLRGSGLRMKSTAEKGWEVLAPGHGGNAGGGGGGGASAKVSPITVERITDDGQKQVFRAEKVYLDVPRGNEVQSRREGTFSSGGKAEDRPEDALSVVLRLENYRRIDEAATLDEASGGSARAGVLPEVSFTDLRPDDPRLVMLLDRSSKDLAEMGEQWMQRRPEDDFVNERLTALTSRVADVGREVTSKKHERIATAIACMLMVITGAVLAMRLRDSLPLAVYLWAFFPALAAVITVNAGQQLTHEHGPIGLLLLWGGVAALGAYTFVEFRKLARN